VCIFFCVYRKVKTHKYEIKFSHLVRQRMATCNKHEIYTGTQFLRRNPILQPVSIRASIRKFRIRTTSYIDMVVS